MIRGIIFDYGNVIAEFHPERFLAAIAPRSSLSPSELKRLFYHDASLVVHYESGMIDSEEFFRRVVEACRLKISQEEFHLAFTNIFTPIPATQSLIKRLKPHFKLGLLSNTNPWHYEAEIATLEVFPLLDAVTLSYEVGAMKPAEKIYRDALGKLQLKADECVYIDDIAENVEAARRLGMHAIQYVSHEQLLASLRSLHIEPSRNY
jgi:putative hydrolase of the HAD superfamily